MPKRPSRSDISQQDVSWKDPPEEKYLHDLVVLLKKHMRTQDFSYGRLAKYAGVSKGTVVALCRGRVMPDLRTIARLEAALRVPLLPDWDAGERSR